MKRQAVAELQKAVAAAEAAAEAKATEMVNSERAKLDRVLLDTRKQVQDEAIATINHQEESSEVRVGDLGNKTMILSSSLRHTTAMSAAMPVHVGVEACETKM